MKVILGTSDDRAAAVKRCAISFGTYDEGFRDDTAVASPSDVAIGLTLSQPSTGSNRVCVRLPLVPIEDDDCSCECCCCECDCGSQCESRSSAVQEAAPFYFDITGSHPSETGPGAWPPPPISMPPLEPSELPPAECVWGDPPRIKVDEAIGLFFDGFGQDGTRGKGATSIYNLFSHEYPTPPAYVSFKQYFANYITAETLSPSGNPILQYLDIYNFLLSLPGAIRSARSNITAAYEHIQEEFAKHVEFHWLSANDRFPIATLCSHIHIDIFGYSWGATEALELAWQLALHPLRCTSSVDGKKYMVLYTPRIRFLGVLSPVDTFINGDMPDEMQDLFDGLQLGLKLSGTAGAAIRAMLQVTAAACKAATFGWSMPHAWTVPAIVDYVFTAYADPRVPMLAKLFALVFQYQKHLTVNPATNISNKKRNEDKPGVPKPTSRAYTYPTNHEYAGGASNGGILMCNDLWFAWHFAALQTMSPEAAAYSPPTTKGMNSNNPLRYPWADPWPELYGAASYKWSWDEVAQGEADRDNWLKLGMVSRHGIIGGSEWPYGNPRLKYDLPWLP